MSPCRIFPVRYGRILMETPENTDIVWNNTQAPPKEIKPAVKANFIGHSSVDADRERHPEEISRSPERIQKGVLLGANGSFKAEIRMEKVTINDVIFRQTVAADSAACTIAFVSDVWFWLE